MDCLNCQSTLPKTEIKVDTNNCCIKCGRYIEPVKPKSIIKLATEHWEKIFPTIQAHTGMEKGSNEYIICEHHYESGFIHGFSHGERSIQEKSKIDY